LTSQKSLQIFGVLPLNCPHFPLAGPLARNLSAGVEENQAARKMNPERFPTSGAAATAQLTMRLTRSQLADLDRFCAGNKVTRSQAARRALKRISSARKGRRRRQV
jgi:hypothetical protein